MSFFINNTEPSEAYFNGSEVSSIYYNGTLVWKVVKFEWGDETAIGDSAWWLALKEWATGASAAERAAWIGKTKKTSLSTAVLGAEAFTMRCIGADEDGEGTLTFESAYLAPSDNIFAGTSTTASWMKGDVRALCQDIYKYCSAKDAIKTVSKGTCAGINTSRNGTPTYNNETVFLLSEREIGYDSYAPISVANSTTTKAECTYGYNAPYSYYANGGSRVKNQGTVSGNAASTTYAYWLRSRYYKSSSPTKMLRISSGNISDKSYNSAQCLAPAFVIG